MAGIDAKHQAHLNDHQEVLLDREEEHRRLLRARVLIADNLRETGEKLNALIAVVDDFIRRQPKQ
jgi:hypoxanthine phosphoribosyltransferase